MSTKKFIPIGPAVWPATQHIYIYECLLLQYRYVSCKTKICNSYISDILNTDYSSLFYLYKLFCIFNTLYVYVFGLFMHIQYTSKKFKFNMLKNRYLNLKLFENYIIHTTSHIFYYRLLMCFFTITYP